MTLIESVATAMWRDHVDLQGYPSGLPSWDEMVASHNSYLPELEEGRLNARAAIAEVFDWLDGVVYLKGTTEREAMRRLEWLAVMRKEALGDKGE